jgi:hypothetical protein
MNKWKKLGLSVGMGAAAISTAQLINCAIFKASVADNITKDASIKKYKWRLGEVAYTVQGKGSPILLIHDLRSDSSSYEWKRCIRQLCKNHRIYTIDLLGCGYSDKPNITYTAYMYTQLLNDFVVNVITRKVAVIATGDSAPLTIMAAYNNPYLFGKIILVSPQSIKTAMINPKKHSNIAKSVLNMPVLGSLIYNICMNRHAINEHFSNDLFAYPNTIPREFNKGYHETAHLGNVSAKYLYSSTQCHYTTASISRAVSQLDNCIYIISGKKETDIKNIIDEYTSLNPAIESFLITNAKHLPQIEQPGEFVQTVNICLS